MKKSFFGLCTLVVFALALTSNSFDNSAFTADTVASVVSPDIEARMEMDGRNNATISVNGTSSTLTGSETVSVTSEGGTASGTITTTSSTGGTSTTSNPTFTSSSTTSSTTTSSSSSTTTTTTGGFNICDYITSDYLRAYFGCD